MRMKSIRLAAIALASACLLSSCGLPGALGRSAARGYHAMDRAAAGVMTHGF